MTALALPQALPLLLIAMVLLASAGLLAMVLRSERQLAIGLGTVGMLAAALLGVVASAMVLWTGEGGEWRAAWPLPIGELHVGVDRLAAFFLLCMFVVAALAAVYGVGYLRDQPSRRSPGTAAGFFNTAVAAMTGVLLARDGILFLVGWELMSVATFFLVTFEDDRDEVRRAGFIYLVASHLGVALLFLLFAVLSRGSGNFDMQAWAAAAPASSASLCFLLALLGFGVKAGLWPLHTWLPEADPAAPSHVASLMSGAMVKLGVYGLLRTLSFLGTPAVWWGELLVALGAISAVVGMLQALAQRDLNRVLAYSSVENLGIIAIGVGLGMLGQSHGSEAVAFLGYAGALLQVMNHGLMKGMLFQTAGAVVRATGTANLDALGGLGKRMPLTMALFGVGALSICALPPFNGFVSEWLIYVSAFRGGAVLPTAIAAVAVVVLVALALVGGLAAACFVRVFGIVFLGAARSDAVAGARELSRWMLVPMGIGAGLCLVLGLWPVLGLRLVVPVVSSITAFDPQHAEVTEAMFAPITRVSFVLLSLVALLAWVRRRLLRSRPVRAAATWGCGYAAPTPRMQYTGVSFAEPLLLPFSAVVAARLNRHGPDGFFPAHAHYEQQVSEAAGERWAVPLARRFLRLLSRLKVLQQGRIQLYLVYVFVALMVLLVWQLAGVSVSVSIPVLEVAEP